MLVNTCQVFYPLVKEYVINIIKVNWVFWTKILGAFEGIIAILIVMGDCWGGFLLFLNLVVSGIFDYQDVTNILQW